MTLDTEVTIANHDLRVVDGGTLSLPKWHAGNAVGRLWAGGLKLPDVYLSQSTQLYPIGTVYREDGRTFVYGKWSATTTIKTAGYAVCTTATYKDLANSVISGTVGGNTIVITASGVTVNQYAGGYLGVKGNNYRSWYIISNTVADGSDQVTFTIDGTIPSTVATTDDVVLMENQYSAMRWYITADTRPYIGVTTNTIVASEYTWIQTWGVHMQCAVFNSFEGLDGNQFPVYVYHGSFQADPTNTTYAIQGSTGASALFQAGFFAAGSDPSSPADISIAYPVYLMFRP